MVASTFELIYQVELINREMLVQLTSKTLRHALSDKLMAGRIKKPALQ